MAGTMEAAETPETIKLKVLSPSTEVQGDITLADIPAATTVRDLRLRIQNEITSKPATDRMRLIYRGRVVVNDADTLLDVFGVENIRTSRDQTLHLVLRELHPTSTVSSPGPTPALRSTTVPPNPFRPAQAPLPSALAAGLPQAGLTQTNPFRTIPQPRPNSQPDLAHPPHAHTHPHAHHHHHHHAHSHQHNIPQQQPPVNLFGQTPLAQLLQQQLQAQQAMARLQQQHTPPPVAQSRNGTPTPADNGPGTPGARAPGHVPASILPPDSVRTVRTETVGPNGERVTVTYSNTSITIPGIPGPQQHPNLPRPFPQQPRPAAPGGPRSPSPLDQLLARASAGLATARQEMDIVRTLSSSPAGLGMEANDQSNLPSWRIDTIRQHMQNLNRGLEQIQQSLSSLDSDPATAFNRDLIQLQQTANDLRGQAESATAMLDRMQSSAPSNEASSRSTSAGAQSSSTSTPNIPTPAANTQTQQGDSNVPSADSRPELFLLSGPSGPVGILFDQRGTYTTAPMVPTLPFQTFTNQFASNRQILSGLTQHMVQNTDQLHNHLAAGNPAQNAQPGPNTPAQPGQAAPQDAQNQNGNQVQPQAPAPENDQVARWAGHMWLVFKLACFVYIFAGHGGWYRPFMIGLAAVIVYLFQLGLFARQANMVRRHFEALLPLGDQPQAANQDQNGQNAANANMQPGRGPHRLHPEQAARRLLQHRQEQNYGWIRQSVRGVERAFALFVASLWPGVGERMVHAQEERERLERVAAEEERQRQEEERRQQEAQAVEEQQGGADEKKTGDLEGRADEVAAEASSAESKGKGKEKAEVSEAAEGEAVLD